MIDNSSAVVDALKQAAGAPGGLPLYGGRSNPGLFSRSARGKQIAQHCLELGLLRIVGTQTNGKSKSNVCTITDKGRSYLLQQLSPSQALDEFVRAIKAQQGQITELATALAQIQETLCTLRDFAQSMTQPGPLETAETGGEQRPPCPEQILAVLSRWQTEKPSEDCPLPQLFQQTMNNRSTLTLGQFHDALRLLCDQRRIYLHPWTGPLYEIPEPAYAMMAGHEIVFYASLRPWTNEVCHASSRIEALDGPSARVAAPRR
jgi:hypothetical protein